MFLTSWKPKLSDSQFCAIICSFIRRHNVKLKYYAVIFIKLHQNQSGRQGISTSKDKSSKKLRIFKKASFLNYRLYRSYLTNCALLDIVLLHTEKWNEIIFRRICRKNLIHPLKIIFIMAQRRSKMSKKEFDDQFEAFLKEVRVYPCTPRSSNS